MEAEDGLCGKQDDMLKSSERREQQQESKEGGRQRAEAKPQSHVECVGKRMLSQSVHLIKQQAGEGTLSL